MKRTCGDCAHWYRPYEPKNRWEAIRYSLWKIFCQPKYSDGKPIIDWVTFSCPSNKYNRPNKHGYCHWDIYPACRQFKPKGDAK